MRPLFILIGAICCIIVAQADLCAGDTSFRCGNSLVSLGDTMYQVREICGEPYSTQHVGEKKTYKIMKNKGLKIESITYLTEWIYKGNNGIYVLTFQGSRLAQKEHIYK